MHTQIESPPDLLTVDQVAAIFGVHAATIRRWTAEGRLPCIRLSRWFVRYRREDVDRLLEPERRDAP